MPEEPSVNPADLALYGEIKPDLLGKDMAGKFVLIKDGQLIDVYNDYKEAYDAAVAQFQPPFLIKEIQAEDRIETI